MRLLLVGFICIGTLKAVGEVRTQNFDSPTNWVSVEGGGNGFDLSFQGEMGGVIARTTNFHSVADSSFGGRLTRFDSIQASGSFRYSSYAGFDGQVWLGHFESQATQISDRYTLGIRFRDRDAASLRAQAVLLMNNGQTGLVVEGKDIWLLPNTTYQWTYVWEPDGGTNGLGKLDVHFSSEGGEITTSVIELDDTTRNLGFAFESFGLWGGYFADEKPGTVHVAFDDVSYTAQHLLPDLPKRLKVFILVGQSNARGKEPSAVAIKSLRDLPTAGLIYDRSWKPIRVPTGIHLQFGAEVTLADQLSRTLRQPVGIVKLAIGASDLKSWTDEHYQTLRTLLADALRDLDEPQIAGFVSIQGESDSGNELQSADYQSRFPALLAQVRLDFGPIPIVVSRIPSFMTGAFKDVVRLAQTTACTDISRCSWVDTDGLPQFGDNIHFSAQGQTQLGYLIADAWSQNWSAPTLQIEGTSARFNGSGKYVLQFSNDLMEWQDGPTVQEGLTPVPDGEKQSFMRLKF